MDGKGGNLYNIFVKWLGRSLEYEEVYLKAYQTVASYVLRFGVNLGWVHKWAYPILHQATD